MMLQKKLKSAANELKHEANKKAADVKATTKSEARKYEERF